MSAYLILAHKNLDQVLRLVQRLNTNHTSFFVHLDKKTDDTAYTQVLSELSKLPNVHFIKRYRCPWGAFGLIRATMTGIETALRTDPQFTHITLLSGQDYPIKPPQHIDSFFDAHGGISFIEYRPLRSGRGMARRIEDWHFYFAGKHWHVSNTKAGIKRHVPNRMQLFKGGACFSLSRECAEYVCQFASQNTDYVRFFKRTKHADESFWHTIILNSSLREKVANDDLRYELWPENEKRLHPEVLRKEHFADIAASSCFFAKKFDSSVDSEILDLIDRDILKVTSS